MNCLTPIFDRISALSRLGSRGLVPVEVGQADMQQRVEVRHDALTGELQVSYTRCDAVQALGILAEAMAAVFRDAFETPLRPPLNSSPSEAHVWLDEREKLRLAFDVAGRPDPVVARGLLAAGLFGLSGADYDPLEALTNGVFVPIGGRQSEPLEGR